MPALRHGSVASLSGRLCHPTRIRRSDVDVGLSVSRQRLPAGAGVTPGGRSRSWPSSGSPRSRGRWRSTLDVAVCVPLSRSWLLDDDGNPLVSSTEVPYLRDAPVAQRIERLPPEQKATGSSPVGRATRLPRARPVGACRSRVPGGMADRYASLAAPRRSRCARRRPQHPPSRSQRRGLRKPWPRPRMPHHRGRARSPDGEKTAWFKDSAGNILAPGSS